jgi:hypothetical protein
MVNSAALKAVKALADAIRELGRVPSGHLYASIMGSVDLETYQAVINILKRANLVSEDSVHELRWIGPYPLSPAGMRP